MQKISLLKNNVNLYTTPCATHTVLRNNEKTNKTTNKEMDQLAEQTCFFT